jgi:uncharacterized protein (TIGR02611 family)
MKNRFDRWLTTLNPRLRRALVFVIGMTMLLFGIAMLVLPGPGIVMILLALALLATEFAWAQSLLKRAQRHAQRAVSKLRRS